MKFASKETAFLGKNDVCRLATASRDAKPHVVPVCYIFHKGYFYIATDYGTKKYNNLLENPQVALVVDTYKPHRAVVVEGKAKILERGKSSDESGRCSTGNSTGQGTTLGKRESPPS